MKMKSCLRSSVKILGRSFTTYFFLSAINNLWNQKQGKIDKLVKEKKIDLI